MSKVKSKSVHLDSDDEIWSGSSDRHLYKDFCEKHELFGVPSLKKLYKHHAAISNGHCAPDSMIMGLHRMGKLIPKIDGVVSYDQMTTREKRDDLRLWRKEVVKVRKDLRDHYIKNMYFYRGNNNDPTPHKIITPDGKPQKQFKGRYATLMENHADLLYKDGMVAEACGFSNYFRSDTWAIVAHYYKQSFVVYSILCDNTSSKLTVFHDYCVEDDKVTTWSLDNSNLPNQFQDMYLSGRKTDICVVCIEHQCHYEFLDPTFDHELSTKHGKPMHLSLSTTIKRPLESSSVPDKSMPVAPKKRKKRRKRYPGEIVMAMWRGNDYNGEYYPAKIIRVVEGDYEVEFEDVDATTSKRLTDHLKSNEIKSLPKGFDYAGPLLDLKTPHPLEKVESPVAAAESNLASSASVAASESKVASSVAAMVAESASKPPVHQHDHDIDTSNPHIVCLSGMPNKEILHSQVKALGGEIVRNFTRDVTHLVVDSPSGAKYNGWKNLILARPAGGVPLTDCKCVYPAWIEACVAADEFVCPSNYLVDVGAPSGNSLREDLDECASVMEGQDRSNEDNANRRRESAQLIGIKNKSPSNLAMTIATPEKKLISLSNLNEDNNFFRGRDPTNPNMFNYAAVPMIRKLVNVTDVNKLLDITVEDNEVVDCKFKSGDDEEGLSKRHFPSDMFNRMIGEDFPPHVPITHQRHIVRKLSNYTVSKSVSRGKPARLPQVLVHFFGYCGYHLDNCKTTWNAGLEYDAVLIAGSNSAPKVPMLLQVEGECKHPDNVERGRCSGSARLAEAKEVRSPVACMALNSIILLFISYLSHFVFDVKHKKTGESAGDRARKNLDNMDAARKGSKNMHGVAAKKDIIYEINRELRNREIRKKGLSTNPLANMLLCQQVIIEQDKELRKNVKIDNDLSCLGVVRRNDWCDGVRVWLWNRLSLIILSQFSQNGRLILHIDSTKYGHFGLKESTDKKILFTPVSLQPGDAFIKQDDKGLFNSEYFTGIVLAEMVSNRNKAQDVYEFLAKLRRDCEDYCGNTLHPRMVHTDEAGQLKNGILRAFAKEGQVKTQIMYSNMATLLYLRLAYIMDIEIANSGDWVESAKWALEVHDSFAGCGIHDCASHIYRNAAEWPERSKREQDAPEVKLHESQFVSMFSTFAAGVKDIDDMSVALSHVCALMAIMSIKRLPCKKYDEDSEVVECYDDDIALKIAENMIDFVGRAAKSIHILSDQHLETEMEDCMKWNDSGGQQFMGDHYSGNILETMIKGLSFSMTILREKNVKKKTGLIEVIVVHWPYDGEGDVSPQCVRGFTTSVDLPYDGEELGIVNKLYSKAGVKYIDKIFRRRGALWGSTGPTMLSKALNITDKASNQHAEGMIGNNKINVTNMQSVHASEPGTYMHRWWRDLRLRAQNMMTEMDRCDGYISQRQQWATHRQKQKSLKNAESEDEDKTEDYKEMEEIDESDMIWERKSRAKEQWKEDEAELRKCLKEAARANKLSVGNKSKMQEALQVFGGKKKDKWVFMSKPTFNKWIDGKAKQSLKKDHERIIKEYIKWADDSDNSMKVEK